MRKFSGEEDQEIQSDDQYSRGESNARRHVDKCQTANHEDQGEAWCARTRIIYLHVKQIEVFRLR